MLNCSIGIMAYNEGCNIGNLLLAIQNQKLREISLQEITVVASGCTDDTRAIVKKFAESDSRIHLLTQKNREGKASAINFWLKSATGDLLILASADTIPAPEALEKLILPFREAKIGMAGAHPVPINDSRTLMGFAAHLMWDLHHKIALQTPKLGETVAFRRTFTEIPAKSSVDEAAIEHIITDQGYQIHYVPEAIISNKGPETISDFLKQRRRIYAGHLGLQKNGYNVATMSGLKTFFLILQTTSYSPRAIFFTPVVILLEIYGRLLGWYDFSIKKREATIWEMAKSTKNFK